MLAENREIRHALEESNDAVARLSEQTAHLERELEAAQVSLL